MPRSSSATRAHHPATHRRGSSPSASRPAAARRSRPLSIPADRDHAEINVQGRKVTLTNLRKLFWPQLGIMKGDLLRYYVAVGPYLLPHLEDRAMVMKRYPNGAGGPFFFMKRAPSPRPDWIELCSIAHGSGNVIDFPIIQDLASLLWVVNLGCIDLNPWYARCDDVDRPDFLNFDLDPVPGAGFERVCETALIVRDALRNLGMKGFAKTTGSKGIHIYVPIARGPTQHQVWAFAKGLAQSLERAHPRLITAEYRVAKRPKDHVLVDYNQNAWGRTLASVYSVRPQPMATVSAPVDWGEIEGGVTIDDFRIGNMSARLAKVGDLWKPLLDKRRRFRLKEVIDDT
jgi:bifunctional non-homologous end joining protein LigD